MDNKLDILIFTIIITVGSFIAYKHFWYREPNAIYVGLSADYKPLVYKDKNTLSGFEVDLMKAIGEKLNKKIIFKEIDFPSLIMSVESKKVDIGISGISPSKQRENVLDFSDIYFKDDFCFLTKNKKLNDLSDLQNLRVGVQQGSVIQELATKYWMHKFNFKLISYNLNTQILQTLEAGHIDAMLIARAEGLEIIEQNEKIKLIDINENNESEGYAMAFAKKSDLKELVNNILKELSSEGVLDDLKAKYKLNASLLGK